MKRVQTLLLRKPAGNAVAHLLLRAPAGRGADMAQWLGSVAEPSFGTQDLQPLRLSVGISFDGLQAMRLPPAYQRVFQRLAPAFVDGPLLRAGRNGDHGASAPQHWHAAFGPRPPHLLLSWHGGTADCAAAVTSAASSWQARMGGPAAGRLHGEALAGPTQGQWLHFGYRDGISELCIDASDYARTQLDPRPHRAGVLLLGHPSDEGSNPFALPAANALVRDFFHDSSFGALRAIEQDVAAFDRFVDDALTQAQQLDPRCSRDWVLAKLAGRWPDGRVLTVGAMVPTGSHYAFPAGTADDGRGCPYASHVRRMRPASPLDPTRPLQRRSLPYTDAATGARGLLGHFFCADLSRQYEHLLGQWAQRPPLGAEAQTGSAADALAGVNDDPRASWLLPVHDGQPPLTLRGLRPWLRTWGSCYAWYPSKDGLRIVASGDFKPFDPEGAWR